MTCEAFLNRLYDDDAREAQRGGRAVPPDIAEHVAGCAGCRPVYESACADEAALGDALRMSPPPAWRAAVLRHAAQPPRSVWVPRIAAVNEAVTWGILAVAASHLLIDGSVTPTHVAAFCTGAAAALLRPFIGKISRPRGPFRHA